MQRRQAEGSVDLPAPSGNWSVEVGETHYLVRNSQDPGQDFSVKLEGEWAYLAWEPADARNGSGRLWISDAGLRGYEP